MGREPGGSNVAALVEREPWPAIRASVAKTTGRVVAAIGYVGQDAHDLLPLKSGDILVCDTSERAVRNGATNPKALRAFLRAGVEVRSEEGLHAKVVVLPRRAYVGSANASSNSACSLVEAAIETTDATAVADLRRFVLERGNRRVDSGEIARLIPLMPNRPRPQPISRRAATLPTSRDLVAVISISLGYWTHDEQRAHDNGHSDAASDARRLGSGIRLDPVSVTPWVYDRLRLGTWVIQFEHTKAHSPGVVVERAAYRRSRMVWVARPNVQHMTTTASSALDAGIPDVDQMCVMRGDSAQRAYELFAP